MKAVNSVSSHLQPWTGLLPLRVHEGRGARAAPHRLAVRLRPVRRRPLRALAGDTAPRTGPNPRWVRYSGGAVLGADPPAAAAAPHAGLAPSLLCAHAIDKKNCRRRAYLCFRLRPSFALTPSIKKKFGRRLRTSVSRLRLSFALKRDDEATRVFGWVLEM